MKLSEEEGKALIKELRFKNGFVIAVVQEKKSKEVLMTAFQNKEAVLKTLTTGKMYYWSRSRKKLWMKGERSGNVQKVLSVKVDCDGDALLYEIEQKGGACHKGYHSCFFRKLKGKKVVVWQRRAFRPEEVYEE